MSSRSATVLVIFMIAILAFCLACVFAAMTGPISILPEESESGGILDNLSAITEDTGDTGNSYGDPSYTDYSTSSSSSDDSQVETTTDDSSDADDSGSGSGSSSGGSSSGGSGSHSDSQVEKTVDPDSQP